MKTHNPLEGNLAELAMRLRVEPALIRRAICEVCWNMAQRQIEINEQREACNEQAGSGEAK